MNSGVYTITNKINGNRYVGSSANLKNRFAQHRRELRNGTHRNRHLQRAWNKYSGAAFGFRKILYCDPEMCVAFEQMAMDALGPEYNIEPIAGSSLGVKRGPLSEETRAKISAALKGHETSEETRAKISAVKKGHKFSEEALSNIRAAIRPSGWRHTKEARAKISAKSKEGYRLGKGIFGQTAKQWENSQKKGGISCHRKGVGVFALSYEQLSENGKTGYKRGIGKRTPEQHREAYEKGLGKFTTEQRRALGEMTRKLTRSQVHEIRHLLALGDMTQKEIAEYYPVATYSSISDIKRGHTYADW